MKVFNLPVYSLNKGVRNNKQSKPLVNNIAFGFDPETSQLDRAAIGIAEKIYNQPIEHLRVLKPSGDELREAQKEGKRTLSGHGISLSEEEAQNFLPGNIPIHNHPAINVRDFDNPNQINTYMGGSFGTLDIYTLRKHGCPKGIVVDGEYIYSIELPKSQLESLPDKDTLELDLAKMGKFYNDREWEITQRDELAFNDRSARHEINKDLAQQYGWKYTRCEHGFSNESQPKNLL